MDKKIYNLIKNKPNKFNSVIIGEMFGIDASDVRRIICNINNNLQEWEFGIISKNNKYSLAITMEDIESKVSSYIAKHKHLLRMESVWKNRAKQLLDNHNKGGGE